MRTNKFFKTGLLLFVASLGLISCGDDDKEPEIVVDPVSENVEYYIEGKVVADNAALEGVSVTAGEATATTDENGQYSLTVKDKKTYTVSFAKKGYRTVSDASVEIANNATNKSLIAFIVTMSMMNVAKGVAYIYSGGRSIRVSNDVFTGIGTGKLFGVLPLPVVYMIVLIIIFIVVLNKTKFGTYIFAIGGNRESARLSGVPIKKVEIAVFTISGFLAAFAGIVLSARMYSGQPGVGEGYELDAIAACVLGGISMTGGVGAVSGTIFGALVIGIISNGLNLIGLSSFWQLVVKGLIIVLAVIIDTQKGKDSVVKRILRNAKERA